MVDENKDIWKKEPNVSTPPTKQSNMITIIFLMLIVVLGYFAFFNASNKVCAEFHYKDNVKIIKGFYQGQTGTVINVQEGCIYNVRINGLGNLKDIPGENLVLIKE